jgi:hypothetical protein
MIGGNDNEMSVLVSSSLCAMPGQSVVVSGEGADIFCFFIFRKDMRVGSFWKREIDAYEQKSA